MMGHTLVAAAILGPLWALLGLARGVDLAEYLVLASSASLSLWLAQLAVQSVKEDRELLAKSGVILALSGLGLLCFGYWLKLRTHHAGLASATYAMVGLGLIVLIALLFSRLRILRASTQVALSVFSVVGFVGLVGLALLGAPAAEVSGLSTELMHGAVGGGLVALAVRHGAKTPPALTKPMITVPLSLLAVSGCALGIASGRGGELLEKAAVLAGLVGLLS